MTFGEPLNLSDCHSSHKWQPLSPRPQIRWDELYKPLKLKLGCFLGTVVSCWVFLWPLGLSCHQGSAQGMSFSSCVFCSQRQQHLFMMGAKTPPRPYSLSKGAGGLLSQPCSSSPWVTQAPGWLASAQHLPQPLPVSSPPAPPCGFTLYLVFLYT